MYNNVVNSYKQKSALGVYEYGNMLVQLLLDMDQLLATNPYSLLGVWIESAKNMSTIASEKLLLEFNARNQVTLWGPRGNINDYANKNWAGLVRDYYAGRWMMFSIELVHCLQQGREYNENTFHDKLLKSEQSWCNNTTPFSAQPQGDVLQISESLHTKYVSYFRRNRQQIEEEWKRLKQDSIVNSKNLFFLFP